MKLDFFQDGKQMERSVVLAEMPAEKAADAAPRPVQLAAKPGLEISVQPLTDAIKEQLQLPPDTNGVVVTEVDPASAAAVSGLQHGDVIQELNRKPVENAEAFQHSLDFALKGLALLYVLWEGSHRFITISLLSAP